MDWFSIKTAANELTGLSRDALHLLSGLGAHVLLALLLRTWLGALLPLAIILAAALVNEWFDLTYEVWPEHQRTWQWLESVKDVVSTMLLPSLLLLLSRLAPRLFTRRPRTPAASE